MSTDLYDQASRYTAKMDPPDFLGWLLKTSAAAEAEPFIRAIQDVAQLEAWLDRALDASSWEDFRKVWQC